MLNRKSFPYQNLHLENLSIAYFTYGYNLATNLIGMGLLLLLPSNGDLQPSTAIANQLLVESV